MANGTVIMPINFLLKTTSLLVYFMAQLLLFKKYPIKKIQENKSNHYLVSWFILYFGSQLILTTASLNERFAGTHIFGDPYRFGINMITFFLYSIMIGLLFFPSILYGTMVVEKEIKEKYNHSKLSNVAKIEILNNLIAYMKGENKPYINEKVSMLEIAIILKISPQQISQVINEKTNLNFNDYVNTFRIEEAKSMLMSNTFSKLTIDAIAQKSGFRSKSAFYGAFKKHTGNTPKDFIVACTDKILPTQLENIVVTRETLKMLPS